MRPRSKISWVFLSALFAMLCCRTASTDVAYNQPFQVVRPTWNHSSLVPVPEGLQLLASHDEKISIVSVAGPYHSGKSFLLNALAGDLQTFKVGRRTSPETMGIWLCRTEMKASDGSEVWLLDSEGFFGPGVPESYDAKVFSLATLLGGHLVYNTVKVIDQQAVDLLEMLARRAQLFRTRSSAEQSASTSKNFPEFLSVREFPPLTWVVEDFVQELPSVEGDVGDGDGATAWLRSYLSKGGLANGTSEDHLLARLYSEVRAHTLFLPATDKMQLQDLSKLGWDELTPLFRDEVSQLKNRILSTLRARRFESDPMRGITLARALRFIVQALQRGMFQEMPSMWTTWASQVAEMSLQDSETWFASLLARVDAHDDPVSVAAFNQHVEQAREKCAQFYRELLKDFDVEPDMRALRDRMGSHFQHKLALYHERVQRWAGELVAKAKDSVVKSLSVPSLELPVVPTTLRTAGENATKRVIDEFSEKLGSFAQKGAPVYLGRAAHMPAFSQDPDTQLRTDLYAIVSTRELENERGILLVFKASVSAADETVDGELKLNSGKLLGKARVKELYSAIQAKCWQAFDEKLVNHKWMMNLDEYKKHKALVYHDTLEGKMARFASANEQRLSAHFRTVLDRVAASYKARKANMAMPASESDLESEHRQLSSAVREQLDEQAGTVGDLKDTESYRGAKKQLDSILDEGMKHAVQKNVELWKVHSDEATRCAIKENDNLMRSCGLFCFFNKVPQVHKLASKKHLIGCFPRSGAGSRMSPLMQMQVFEDWYSKDLAHDAAVVWNNFYLGSAVVGLLVLIICGGCRARSSGDMTHY